jgi:hypothetical protein
MDTNTIEPIESDHVILSPFMELQSDNYGIVECRKDKLLNH